MKIPRNKLATIITELTFKNRISPEKLSREIAAYLLKEKRTGELDSLLRDVSAQRAENGVIEATVVVARELTPEVIADVEARVKACYPKARQIIINQRIEKSLIGGMRLELPDSQLDLSVRAKLNRLKQLTISERTET